METKAQENSRKGNMETDVMLSSRDGAEHCRIKFYFLTQEHHFQCMQGHTIHSFSKS